ncbi:MAG: hypothetical protein Edafosvirus17_23 [Edafosvirus sp.]|uniref:PH domain-containing protein n=1 Tax=Edafosvirus sp. TaxID=2487765 RepID=A0A3G4ZUH9_9VIRU|nr:MAG: hypothetical protein Edafosvirus17_23 [Edafosvirus sp.]
MSKSDVKRASGNEVLIDSSTPSSSTYVEEPTRENKGRELWATVQIPTKCPFFGAFLQIFDTPRAPINKIRFNVEPPTMSENGLPIINTWEPSQQALTNTPFLKMDMAGWPIIPDLESNWIKRLFSGRTFTGFYTRANMFAYHSVSKTNPLDDTKEIIPCRSNIIIYYGKDNTSMGSLYWYEGNKLKQNSIPLHKISDVFIGMSSPFFSNVVYNKELSLDDVNNNCFSLKILDGILLNLNAGSTTQRDLWLRKIKNLMVSAGQICVKLPYNVKKPISSPTETSETATT